MSVGKRVFPDWVHDAILGAVIVLAVALPGFFYVSVNRGKIADSEQLFFSGNDFLGNIDTCEIEADHVLVRGWALVVGEDKNSPTEVFIEDDNGNMVRMKSRVIPRPDVDEYFDISYRNSAVGFSASSGLLSETISLPTRIALVKESLLGERRGAYYDCQG
ncbi:hypothetical protein GCM10027040_21980 [Halomonas shantousis]